MMLNGALTIGSMDGAPVEIVDEVGKENAFIFGLTSDQVIAYERDGGYDPVRIYQTDPNVKMVVDRLIDGTFAKDKELFRPLYDSLMTTKNSSRADRYFILADFESYADAQQRVREAYQDQKRWAQMAMLNTFSSGKFSSDRTIEQYVDEIWHLDRIRVEI